MCGIFAIVNEDGQRVSGQAVVDAMDLQKDRGNGLGAGFAGYGIYPDHPNEYALHVMYENGKYTTGPPDPNPEIMALEKWLGERLRVSHTEEIGLDADMQRMVIGGPYFKRYFVNPLPGSELRVGLDDEAAMEKFVLEINQMPGIFVLSCGKNMGVFKGVGYPADIAKLFRLSEYEGWMWIAHSRYPTNTPDSWFGAHPFTMLGTAFVHNGEITSYGANAHWIEQYGYSCTMLTDTEVLAYIYNKLQRDGLGIEEACSVMAPPLWTEIDRTDDVRARQLRQFYRGAAIIGPFAIVISDENGLVALCDRDKLRPLVVARMGSTWAVSSEECSFYSLWPEQPEEIIRLDGGQPIIIQKEVRS